MPPAEWSQDILREFGKRCSIGPWREGNWGALPGTVEGSTVRRYYFVAERGYECFVGVVVANSRRAVETWLRDVQRAWEFEVSKDVRLLYLLTPRTS